MSSVAPWDDAVAILTAGAGVPIEWPNAPFNKPNPLAPYISVEMTGDSDTALELGPHAPWIERGRLYIDIHAAANAGTRPSRLIGQNILALFRNLGPRDVVWTGGSLGMGGRSDTDGNWWTLNLSLTYTWQSIIV